MVMLLGAMRKPAARNIHSLRITGSISIYTFVYNIIAFPRFRIHVAETGRIENEITRLSFVSDDGKTVVFRVALSVYTYNLFALAAGPGSVLHSMCRRVCCMRPCLVWSLVVISCVVFLRSLLRQTYFFSKLEIKARHYTKKEKNSQ